MNRCYVCDEEISAVASYIDPNTGNEHPERVFCKSHPVSKKHSNLLRCKKCNELVSPRFPVCLCGYGEASL